MVGKRCEDVRRTRADGAKAFRRRREKDRALCQTAAIAAGGVEEALFPIGARMRARTARRELMALRE
jgi:hypothetical protein